MMWNECLFKRRHLLEVRVDFATLHSVHLEAIRYGIGVVIWVEEASKIYIFPFCLQEGLSSSADAMLLLRKTHDVGF